MGSTSFSPYRTGSSSSQDIIEDENEYNKAIEIFDKNSIGDKIDSDNILNILHMWETETNVSLTDDEKEYFNTYHNKTVSKKAFLKFIKKLLKERG